MVEIAEAGRSLDARTVLLGIDVGTTNVKAIAYTAAGEAVASASARHETHRPRPGWAEYDSEELFASTARAVKQVVSTLAADTVVAGVAVASMAETAIPLGADGQPLRRAIAWHDERAVPQSDWWRREVGEERVAAITGLPVMPIFGINKIMWLRDNEPDIFAKIRAWLNVADYIAFRLTGAQATDYSLASRLMVLDLQGKRWSQELLSACEIREEIFAELVPSGQQIGVVHSDAHAATGLPRGTPVASGGMDHPCGALALGLTRSGDILDSMGTSESLFSVTSAPQLNSGLAEAGYQQGVHTVSGTYYCNGGLYTSGACVEWLRGLLSPDGETSYDALIESASRAEPGSAGVFFLPHLLMANTPVNDVLSRGAFVGLSASTDRGSIARAVFEGLAYEAQLALDGLVERLDLKVERVRAIGGGTRNELLMQVKASLLPGPIEVLELDEAASLGAALIAGIGVGIYRDADSAAAAVNLASREVSRPHEATVEYHRRAYESVYKKLYPRLAGLSHEIATLRGSPGAR
ncbi:MAG: FGGY family carbohydrate kinase [Trueperaceae bacterium]